ncbi:uncharacterized protein [Paramormyrops kingsleyae]|uniref:Uncharacterized LOC111859367 n=1 Tax=Paramormyrops kingsleyae TaxID=1676925 RepID=A0A3B3QB96_9TELE|nr:uncharacterized protein LOC111859367 [Paramormyrops kingsleyae]XP_023697719.1 uncharacterized protein LOC111859367 [Paramormyrops kingsleyae]
MRKDHIEPWIEDLIQSYNIKERQDRMKAHILGLGKLPDPQEKLTEDPVALLFLSDGLVQIPGILTRTAWEKLQELEERESLQSITKSTVFLCKYNLEFQLEPEDSKCQFFLTIHEMATMAPGPVKCHIPSCTTLSSVRQKIYETWRSLQNDGSVLTTCTQSAFCLSELVLEWQDNRTTSLLKDLSACLLKPSRYHPPSPQPSTSRQSCPPALLSRYLTTGWDTDRVRYKGDPPFTVPISQLNLPAEQRLQLPHESAEVSREEDAILQDVEDVNSSLIQDSEPANPWDMFDSAGADTSSLLCDQESPSGSITLDGICPAAMSTQALTSHSHELFVPAACDEEAPESETRGNPPAPNPPLTLNSEVSVRSEDRSLPPYQRPSTTFTTPPCSDGPHSSSFFSTKNTRDEEEEHIKRKLGRARKRTHSLLPMTEKGPSEEDEEEPQSGNTGLTKIRSPPSWLLETQEGQGGPGLGQNACSQSTTTAKVGPFPGPQRKLLTVHSDGAPFSYKYQPTVRVLEALRICRVPDKFLQWSVWYLAHSDRREGTG